LKRGKILDLNDLLFEFSHKEKYHVLKELYHESKRYGELQNELTIPGSEISRDLKSLKNKNLVKNSREFIYAITDQYQKSLFKEAENKMRNQSIKIRALVDINLLKSYNIPDGW
jgi:DNA-binding HxlR family transcriptional regulator